MRVFARINFACDARANGLELPDTELLVFGNPKVGTKLLRENQHVGIELPLKVLVFTNTEGLTLMEFNDPVFLADRFGVDVPDVKALSAMQVALLEAAREATGSDFDDPD